MSNANIKNKVKIWLKTRLIYLIFKNKVHSYEMKRFGSTVNGWVIITNAISRKTMVYSFGIGYDASFDIELINTYGLPIHAFDPTPFSIEWVRKQNFPDEFVFHDYGIADFDGNIPFYPPENPKYTSYSILERKKPKEDVIIVPVKRLISIMSELGHQQIDILKMDIEGAEYKVVDDILSTSIRPNQILIEFHHRYIRNGFIKTLDSINKLEKVGYQMFYYSKMGNEFSFIYSRT